MSHQQICKRCILPDSYPRITFDSEGICSICKDYEKWRSYWESHISQQKKILDNICSKAKSKHKEFDALIPYSGGKDSSFVLYMAKEKLGLNCLSVTLDNGYLSEFAKSNIDKACRKLGIEHIYYRFNPDVMNRLFGLFVRKTGYPCTACMRAMQMSIARVVDMYDIPLIITGTSLRTELPLSHEMAEHGEISHVRGVLKDEPIAAECKRLLSGLSLRQRIGHMLFRLSGRKRLITHAWFALPEYLDWNYSDIQDTIKRELDWDAPRDDEHMDCILHSIQKYIQLRRFPDLSLDRLRFARLIMAGQMKREEALHILETQKEQFSDADLNLFLKNIKMSKAEFDKYIDMGPRHLQYYLPTMTERMIELVFPRRIAAKY